MRLTFHPLRLTFAALALSGLLDARSQARSETVLRVAMMAGDISDWTGAPDQGYEGYRLVGFSLYNSMVDGTCPDWTSPPTSGLATTRTAALLSGQADFVEAPSPGSIPKLKAAGVQIILVPYPHNRYYQLRVDRPPFKDLRVRRTANLTINRDEIVEILQGGATPGYGRFIESQACMGIR